MILSEIPVDSKISSCYLNLRKANSWRVLRQRRCIYGGIHDVFQHPSLCVDANRGWIPILVSRCSEAFRFSNADARRNAGVHHLHRWTD